MTYVRMNKIEERMAQEGNKRDAFESMLARFNRQVGASGIFRELKSRESYEKPSDKRRRKAREAKLRMLRREGKNAVHQSGKKRPSRPVHRTTSVTSSS